jgi:hypothetical protein
MSNSFQHGKAVNAYVFDQKGTKHLVIVDDISDSSVQEYLSESYYFFFVFTLALPVEQISQHVSHDASHARFNLEETSSDSLDDVGVGACTFTCGLS